MGKRALFQAIIKEGMLVYSKHLSFKYKLSPEAFVTVVVSKKTIPSAVVRNKLKRRIRALFSESQNASLSGIFFAKKGIDTLSFHQLEKEVFSLLQKTKGKSS